MIWNRHVVLALALAKDAHDGVVHFVDMAVPAMGLEFPPSRGCLAGFRLAEFHYSVIAPTALHSVRVLRDR